MLKTAIAKLIDRQHLTRDEAFQVMESIMQGQATPAQLGALLVAMRMKGETPTEIAGFAASMRRNALHVSCSNSSEAIDLVGTGGDGRHTFNVSTVASFIAAGAGVVVAKHGNRSVSSKCGSADVLMALGINIELDNSQLGTCLEQVGLAFLFAPKLHVAMKHAIGPRREIGVRSFFNILGPITNPANVKRQLIGVYDPGLQRFLAEVLQQLGSQHVMLVHSRDGLDEISVADATHVVELKDGTVREYDLTPEDFGLQRNTESIIGGDAQSNANIALAVLRGEKGAPRDISLANAAAGIYVAGKAASLQQAAEHARESLDSGAALAKLEQLRTLTNVLMTA